MIKAEAMEKELTLDEVYQQNKKMIDSQRARRKAQVEIIPLHGEQKKPNFFRRFGKTAMTLFFE